MSIARVNTISEASALAPACAPPDFSPRKPQLEFPALACDCHAHILGPAAKYAYAPTRVYTPPDCLMGDYQHMLNTLGVARAVLVQPSVYGADNSVLLRALASRNPNLRGVVVVEPDIEIARLQEMHVLGVRGVRVNVVDVQADAKSPEKLPLDLLRPLAEKIEPLGWHMEFLLHVDEFPSLDEQLANFPVQVVFGHLGYARAATAKGQAGFNALLNLLKADRGWVKLTGPYRIATAVQHNGRLGYDHVADLAQTLLAAAPHRVVWGSDWPHVMHKGPMPNDGDLADLIADWIPDPSARQRVLADNPAKLYDFLTAVECPRS